MESRSVKNLILTPPSTDISPLCIAERKKSVADLSTNPPGLKRSIRSYDLLHVPLSATGYSSDAPQSVIKTLKQEIERLNSQLKLLQFYQRYKKEESQATTTVIYFPPSIYSSWKTVSFRL
jgi:hypothetical protein